MTDKLHKENCTRCGMDIYSLSEQIHDELQEKMVPELRGLCHRCVEVECGLLNLCRTCKGPL
jgi:hypothetical protein